MAQGKKLCMGAAGGRVPLRQPRGSMRARIRRGKCCERTKNVIRGSERRFRFSLQLWASDAEAHDIR